MPENTVEAFDRAFSVGANALETDAHMTRDGKVVLAHDETGQRMAGVERAIRDVTYEEIRTWDVGKGFRGPDGTRPDRAYRVPLLAEVLSTFPDAFVNIDAKQTKPDMMPALVRIIREARAQDRVRIASFSSRNLRHARSLGYQGALGTAAVELARAIFAPRIVNRMLPLLGDAAQVPEHGWGITFAKQSMIDRLHEAGLRVDFWTIDDPARARALLAMGADGIVTNDPRRICDAVGVTAQKSS